MVAITKINTHIADAKARLIEEYKGKPHFEGFLKSINTQIQELEDINWQLKDERDLDNAIGQQLDGIGEIVGLPRPQGMEDEPYRIRLRAQILILISNGEPELLIRLFLILTSAEKIHFLELALASFSFSSEVDLTQDEVDEILLLIESAAVGGARCEEISTFDDTNPFAFDGVFAFGGGFGDTGDASKGGKLGTTYPLGVDFAFSAIDDNQSHSGFGDKDDNRTGAKLISL